MRISIFIDSIKPHFLFANRDTLDHRNDLMSKLMRKRNSEMWQLRQSPMYKTSGRSMGSKH